MSLDQPDLRIGDDERDDATRLLQEHLAAGRLDAGEFESRMTRALESTHASQLRALFDDLPGRRPGQQLALPVNTPPPARAGVPLWVWPTSAAAALWFGGIGMMSAARAVMADGPRHMPPDVMAQGAQQAHGGFMIMPIILMMMFAAAVVLSVLHRRRLRRHRRRG